MADYADTELVLWCDRALPHRPTDSLKRDIWLAEWRGHSRRYPVEQVPDEPSPCSANGCDGVIRPRPVDPPPSKTKKTRKRKS